MAYNESVEKRKRKQRKRYRKNFFPALTATGILWASFFLLVYFVDPKTSGVIALFFIILFTSLLFTLSLAFKNTRRGFISSISITFFLILKILGVGNVINLILLLGLAVAVEILFSNSVR